MGQENATIQVTMEKENKNSVSSNTTETTTVSSNDVTSASGGKITIDAPKGVEVYMDGSYIGIAPVSFKKTAGIHVITLRLSGYETRSYTINIENLVTNENLSFSDLVEEEKTEEKSSEENKENPENP